MLSCFVTNDAKGKSLPISLITQSDYAGWLAKQSAIEKNWLQNTNFRGEPGCIGLIPDEKGNLKRVILCIADKRAFWCAGSLPTTLPSGIYHFDLPDTAQENLALGWGLGSYQFTRYKKPSRTPAQLLLPKKIAKAVNQEVSAIYMVRDLINTPTDDLGPSEFAKFVKSFCLENKVQFSETVGKKLLDNNYPLIYNVGRACDDEPRLLDLRWGNKKYPRVTLVGKGVCFDSGGLDIKNAAAMLLMKKDMGGAAQALGLAQMIIQANLSIQLRVLIPLVENSVGGNAYRPGDVIKSRKGLTVEIGNTDAEGRLVLADALTEALSNDPNLLIDFATLTGAARIAVGTDIAAMFCNKDDLAAALLSYAEKTNDPMCRLPLFTAYRESLNSCIADINNAGSDGYAGAITAALFLKEFVPDNIPWVHFDLMAWNLKNRPGRPQGGEAMAIRALFGYLVDKYKRE